jgi:hypothetical protein
MLLALDPSQMLTVTEDADDGVTVNAVGFRADSGS